MEESIQQESDRVSAKGTDEAQKEPPKPRALLERYLEQGLELVKVRPRGKAPSEEGWPDLPQLSLQEALDWLNRGGNIGAHLGRERGRIYAIDVDGYGIEKFFSLNPSLSQRVRWIETSPSRGRILVCGNAWKAAGTHDLQVLADRKQVLLPPSIHPNGHRYAWRGAAELPIVLEAEPSEFKFPFSMELSSSALSNRNLSPAQQATLERLEELLCESPEHIVRAEAYWNCPKHGDDKTASFSYNLANHKYHCFHKPDPLSGQGLGKLEKAIGSSPRSIAAPAVCENGKGEERKEKGEATGDGSGGNGSGQLVKLSEVYKALDDIISSPYAPDVVDLAAATVLNARLIKEANAKPLWLCIVGAPSSGKTEIIAALKGLSQVYYLDDITTNAFSSGYVEKGKKPKDIDLLPKLDGKCFAVKDLSPLFSKRAEAVQELLGQLPPIYDGEYDKATGTLGTVRYKSKFAWLSCITPEAIRAHQDYMAKLGSRILFYELPSATPAVVSVGFRLQDNPNRAEQVQRFSELFSRFAEQLLNAPLTLPILSAPVFWSNYSKLVKPEAELKRLAQLIANGRALAHMEDKRWIVTQSESPFRVYEQLRVTAQALALVHGRSSVTDHDLDLIRRVALSSMPKRRSEVLRLLSDPSHQIPGAMLTAQLLAGVLGYSQDTALRNLKELEAIRILEPVPIGGSKAQGFRPKADFMEWLTWPLRPMGPFHWMEAHGNEDHPEIISGVQYSEHFNQPLT